MIFNFKLLAAVTIAIALAIGSMPKSADAQVMHTSGQIVDFSLRDLDGHVTKLSQYRGHPVVIDFWATWCAPCRHQIPELKKLYTKYHRSRGLVVLGIACDTVQGDGAQSIRPFVKEFEINYPILLAEAEVLDTFGVDAIPTTLFLGPDGSVVGRVLGAGASGELTEGVNALLANPTSKSKPAKKLTPEEEKKENRYDIEYVQ
ncbi:MAG TPA: TlpA disulfide reductase family protein [Candidatus Binataceae bacterium]|nr:TlpA disulfide reductase family protein [Candidatus Binataceae bacterium]